MTLKTIALSLAITLTTATAIYALTNRIAIDRAENVICVISTVTSPLTAGVCAAPIRLLESQVN